MYPPPPPPIAKHNPLDVPIEWYIDMRTADAQKVMGERIRIQETHLTSVSIIAGGEQSEWARLCVFGKPLGIHHTIAEISTLLSGNLVEVGYTTDVPFPDHGEEFPMPVMSIPLYHAAWTEYCMQRR